MKEILRELQYPLWERHSQSKLHDVRTVQFAITADCPSSVTNRKIRTCPIFINQSEMLTNSALLVVFAMHSLRKYENRGRGQLMLTEFLCIEVFCP